MDTIPPGYRVVVWRKHKVRTNRKVRFRTICEVLRELEVQALARGDTLAVARILEATDMAKRMQRRLEHYAGNRQGLVNDPQLGMVWVEKAKLMLTDAELAMVLHRRGEA